jgi:histidinol-phosphatase (PHP family)
MRDYHIHTPFCKHAHGEMAEYIESAIEKGIVEICFTDHIPLPDGFDANHRMAIEDMDDYFEEIRRLREMYPDISILTGIEADYIQGYEKYLEDFFSRYPLDLALMSIHFVKGWPNNAWVFSYSYTEQSISRIYHSYFQAMCNGINSGLFDVIGHMDLVKRPNFPIMDKNSEDVQKVLDCVSKQNMGIEINTSGLRKSISETYPSYDIIERIAAKGIPMIIGSDSHSPQQLGSHFADVLKEVSAFKGFKLARYKNRKIAGIEMLALSA